MPLIYVIYGKEKGIFKIPFNLWLLRRWPAKILRFYTELSEFLWLFLKFFSFQTFQGSQAWIFTFWQSYFSRVLTNRRRYVKIFSIHYYIKTCKKISPWYNEPFSSQRPFFKKLTPGSVFLSCHLSVYE